MPQHKGVTSSTLESKSSYPEPRYFGREKSRTTSDKIFSGTVIVSALSSLLILTGILVYLSANSLPIIIDQGISFITGSEWSNIEGEESFQIWPMLYGSLFNALIGLVIAVPISVLLALFIVFLAPKALSKTLIVVIDILAAIPSGIIGLWGFIVFTPVASNWAELLNKYLGFIPLFANDQAQFARSPFIAGWILAIMIIPIVTVVSREVLAQTPQELIDASRGLGGSLSGAIRMVALPYARGGIIGGVMLGLGRALGETIAIFFVLNLIFDVNYYQLLLPEGGAIASMIVAKFGEATPIEINALLGAGLILFVMTLIVNLIANAIVKRSTREKLS
jgi:phosphate transport system permease protein